MSDQNSPKIELEIPIQISESKDESAQKTESASSSVVVEEMPTITTLLQRKKLTTSAKSVNPAASAAHEPMVNPAPKIEPKIEIQNPVEKQPSPANTPMASEIALEIVPENEEPKVVQSRYVPKATSHARPSANNSGPPPFTGQLILEPLELKAFEKNLKKFKNSLNIKKLACLSYFSTRFTEITYFKLNEPGHFRGVLGYGNSILVSEVKNKSISAESLPSVFGILSQNESFVGPLESFRAEDHAGMASIGFTQTGFVGIFPIIVKKNTVGAWICAAATLSEIPAKEQKALKKIFANLLL